MVDDPGVLDSISRRDTSQPRDCVVSFRGPQESAGAHDLHLLLVGAYESVQQQKTWTFDPVMAFLGQYDGRVFVPEATVSHGERCAPHACI